ncbi:hypothetical protein BDP67DRAFT_365184, partial [Colletotrichum lupini]
SSSASVNPLTVGDASYLGCFRSPTSFPTFVLTQSAASMTIERCIAACPSSKYVGLFANDCFCGSTVDSVNEISVPDDQCNIPCGGNSAERCGGQVGLTRRQLIGLNVRFTIYIRLGLAGGTTASATVTTSFTTTTTGTVTSCPPGVSTCAIGSLTTGVTTVTTTYCPTETPAPNPCSNGQCYGQPCYGDDCYKKLVCYGDYVSFDYPCYGDECRRRLVCVDGLCHPETCSGYDCGRKIICKSGLCGYSQCQGDECIKEKITCYGNACKIETCSGDECYKKYVCTGDMCEHETCPYTDVNKKYECTDDKCKVVTPCNGDCPKPQPPSTLPYP